MCLFPQMHASEVQPAGELKVCEHCSGHFLRMDKHTVFCGSCRAKPYVRLAKKQPKSHDYWVVGLRRWR